MTQKLLIKQKLHITQKILMTQKTLMTTLTLTLTPTLTQMIITQIIWITTLKRPGRPVFIHLHTHLLHLQTSLHLLPSSLLLSSFTSFTHLNNYTQPPFIYLHTHLLHLHISFHLILSSLLLSLLNFSHSSLKLHPLSFNSSSHTSTSLTHIIIPYTFLSSTLNP